MNHQFLGDVRNSNIHRTEDRRREENVNVDGSLYQTLKPVWTQHLTVLLEGARDPSSPLRVLRGYEDVIIKDIYTRLYESWSDAVEQTTPAGSVERVFDNRRVARQYIHVTREDWMSRWGKNTSEPSKISFAVCGCIQFPDPRGINVNMMPFVLGDESSLPEEIRHYQNIIMGCPVNDEEIGKVCYLTVQEGFVSEKQTQRRSGLHIEAPNQICLPSYFIAGRKGYHWGGGTAIETDDFHGGLYMASNVDDSCAIWNALVTDKTVVDCHGGMEHLRPFIGDSYKLEANELVWFTDCTPHEALPQVESGHRQFFRLVTSDISAWYEDHSTENPLVPLPVNVGRIKGNKFLVGE